MHPLSSPPFPLLSSPHFLAEVRIIGSVAAACHTVQSHLAGENREKEREAARGRWGRRKKERRGREREREREIDHLNVLGPVFHGEALTFLLYSLYIYIKHQFAIAFFSFFPPTFHGMKVEKA